MRKRNRNVIAYYSGHLQKPRLEGTEICDEDKNEFLNVVHDAFMLTFVNTTSFKIVENHKGVAMIYSAHPQLQEALSA